MQIVEFHGKKWAIELEWEILSGEGSVKEEAKEVAVKNKCSYGVIVDYDSQTSIGLIEKNPPKEPIGSYMLALANQEFIENKTEEDPDDKFLDWIVVEEVGEKYWISVIKHGHPAPQFDKLFDLNSVREKIHELIIVDTYRVYSNAPEIAEVLDGIKLVESKGLNELTDGIKPKIKYEKLKGIPTLYIQAGIASVILLGLLWGGLSFMEGRDLAEKARNFQQQKEKERLRREAEYQLALKNYEESFKKNQEKAFSEIKNSLRGNPYKILNVWYDTVGNLEVGTHGWTLKTVECYYNSGKESQREYEFGCDFLYSRNGLSTNRMLLEDFPSAKIVGDQAVVTIKPEVDASILMEVKNENLNSLSSAKGWNYGMISQLQLLKLVDIDYKIEKSTEIFFEDPEKPVSPQEADMGKAPTPAKPISTGVAKGELVVSGNNFEFVKEFSDNIDFDTVALRKIKFDVKGLGEISWVATFNYFVGTKDGGLASSASNSLSNLSVEQKKDEKN